MSERKLIGYVSVDSGALVIVDPIFAYGEPEDMHCPNPLPLDFRPLLAAIGPEGRQLGTGSWGSAIAVGTGVGDGIFPVYREGNRVVIELDEWLWDGQDGTGLQPATQESATRLASSECDADGLAVIKAFRFEDRKAGHVISVEVSPLYSKLRVDETTYFFVRETGAFDGLDRAIGLTTDSRRSGSRAPRRVRPPASSGGRPEPRGHPDTP